VHRDVKSSNLLFDEHGHVRIADFGLARALAEASWTEPDGGLIGTARYAAPEQARGAALDGRADLYSLAIVLGEAVTGQVPNVGETAVATVAARQREGIAVPRELGRLGPVLARAGRPDPNDRYPDATAMSNALDEAARQLAPPEPLVLPGLGAVLDDPEPTHHAGGRVVDPDRTVGAGGPGLFDQDAAPATTRRAVPEPVVVYREHRILPAVAAIAIVAALVVAAVVFVGAAGGSGGRVAAPALVGMPRADAAAKLATKGLVVEIEQRRSDDPKGLVIGQSPDAGAFLGGGGTVRLFVSSGPPPVTVPTVGGLSQNEAQALLESRGFVVAVEARYDETVPKGIVITTSPTAPGAKAPADSELTLVVSNGPTPIPIVDVKGLSYDEAAAKLTAAGFAAARKDVFDDVVETGKVVGTEPAAGQGVVKGSTVTILVSKGPELVTVPNLKNLTVEEASKALTDLGLVPNVQNYGPGRRVRAQDPDPGEKVKKGSAVTLFLL
jgi:serine/threonine-protein kinase